MKKLLYKIGVGIINIFPMKIVIIDDVDEYMNESMLEIAESTGGMKFERYNICDKQLLNELVLNPRDILIMDIKDSVEPDVGKDGFDVASHIYDNTPTFVAVTSAHFHKLRNQNNYGDYTIVERLTTPVDFTKEMKLIIDICLEKKIKSHKKIGFKLGKSIIRYSVTSGA